MAQSTQRELLEQIIGAVDDLKQRVEAVESRPANPDPGPPTLQTVKQPEPEPEKDTPKAEASAPDFDAIFGSNGKAAEKTRQGSTLPAPSSPRYNVTLGGITFNDAYWHSQMGMNEKRKPPKVAMGMVNADGTWIPEAVYAPFVCPGCNGTGQWVSPERDRSKSCRVCSAGLGVIPGWVCEQALVYANYLSPDFDGTVKAVHPDTPIFSPRDDAYPRAALKRAGKA